MASSSSPAAGTSSPSGTDAVPRGRVFGVGATALLFAGLAFLISTRGGTPAGTIRVPGGPQGLATGDGAVWIASADDGRVSRLDPHSHHGTATDHSGGALRHAPLGRGR